MLVEKVLVELGSAPGGLLPRPAEVADQSDPTRTRAWHVGSRPSLDDLVSLVLSTVRGLVGCPAADSSIALAASRWRTVHRAGSNSTRAAEPGSAPGGRPVSTSTTCRSHSLALSTISGGK